MLYTSWIVQNHFRISGKKGRKFDVLAGSQLMVQVAHLSYIFQQLMFS